MMRDHFFQNIIDNQVIVSNTEDGGIYSLLTFDKSKLVDDSYFSCEYNEGRIVVPIDDVREVLSTGDMEVINEYIKQIDEFKKSVEEQQRDLEEAEEEDQYEYEEEEEFDKESAFTEEEKRQLAEEILKDQEMKEIAEAFEKEENATTITKEQIKELYADLMSKVIGQEEAIETACYVLYKNGKLKDGESKTNCIFVGPTGSGKSMIADIIGEFFKDKPLVHVDSNSLSTTGYVGDNVEDCLAQLLMKADGDKFIAEHGIVVFDEVDKKGTSDNGDVGGKGVINQLLRFVEGQQYKVEYMVNNKKRSTIFDTTNLTIFACGAFPEVYEELINKTSSRKGIGFTNPPKSDAEMEREKREKFNSIEISHEDLATKGRMGPEFTGRFIIAPLRRLNKDALKEILVTSKASPLTREVQLLEEDNICFYNDEKFIDAIASKAYEEGTGGRGVKNSIEKVFKKIIKKTVLTLDDEYVDEESGKIYLYGTADDEGNLQVKTAKGNNILEDEPKEKAKVLKI